MADSRVRTCSIFAESGARCRTATASCAQWRRWAHVRDPPPAAVLPVADAARAPRRRGRWRRVPSFRAQPRLRAALPTAETDAFLGAWDARRHRDDGRARRRAARRPRDRRDVARQVRFRRAPRSTRRTGLVRTKTGARPRRITRASTSRASARSSGTARWRGLASRPARPGLAHQAGSPTCCIPGSAGPAPHRVAHVAGARVDPRGRRLAARRQLRRSSRSASSPTAPRRVSARSSCCLQSLVGTDPASVDAALHAPGVQPNFFVPVATVPDDTRYRTVLRPQLVAVPGVFFRRGQAHRRVGGRARQHRRARSARSPPTG